MPKMQLTKPEAMAFAYELREAFGLSDSAVSKVNGILLTGIPVPLDDERREVATNAELRRAGLQRRRKHLLAALRAYRAVQAAFPADGGAS